MKDLERARHAFDCAERVATDVRKAYRPRAHALGPNILRSGLAAAVTFLEREAGEKSPGQPAAQALVGHLALAKLPGLEGATASDFPGRLRALDVDDYILATREALALCLWLRRAVQAWPDEPGGGRDAGGAA